MREDIVHKCGVCVHSCKTTDVMETLKCKFKVDDKHRNKQNAPFVGGNGLRPTPIKDKDRLGRRIGGKGYYDENDIVT